MAATSPESYQPPSQQDDEEGNNKQAPRHSLETLSTAAAAATAASMERVAGVAKANSPSTFFSNGDSSASATESSLRKLMTSSDSAASASFLAKMFNTSDKFKSGDSTSFMSNFMKSNDIFNSDIFKSMGMDQMFKSGETANMFKSSGDSANNFKSKDMSSIFKSTSSVAGGANTQPSSTVAGMINTKIPDVFTSRDWAADYKPEHHDVEDVQKVFYSNGDCKINSDPTTRSTVTPSTSGKTDWRALQEKKLTPASRVVHVQPVSPSRPSSLLMKTNGESVDSMEKKTLPKRKRSRPYVEPEVKEYVEPTDRDVLLGRGGRTNHHVGNRTYLEAKESIQERYMLASKNDKTSISQDLVDIITSRGGRFLKLDDEVNKWYPVPNIVARKKASQTLREVNSPEERASKRSKYTNATGKTKR